MTIVFLAELCDRALVENPSKIAVLDTNEDEKTKKPGFLNNTFAKTKNVSTVIARGVLVELSCWLIVMPPVAIFLGGKRQEARGKRGRRIYSNAKGELW